MTTSDPLLQPYQLKHLTLKNGVMSTSHEPAYFRGRYGSEDHFGFDLVARIRTSVRRATRHVGPICALRTPPACRQTSYDLLNRDLRQAPLRTSWRWPYRAR
ncbi:MAG: hypothetical protein EOS14_33440 [Mesorhizobium sp.]|nr:MAG: hypothetical protein EOS14_33440 [Mesorhizobium sp.]